MGLARDPDQQVGRQGPEADGVNWTRLGEGWYAAAPQSRHRLRGSAGYRFAIGLKASLSPRSPFVSGDNKRQILRDRIRFPLHFCGGPNAGLTIGRLTVRES